VAARDQALTGSDNTGVRRQTSALASVMHYMSGELRFGLSKRMSPI
jgi:hypothetical protein